VTIKDGFEVTMNKTCTELIIEAEDQGNGSVFSSRFSNDAIKGMGLECFENVSELFEGLLTAFEGASEDTSAKLSQDGKLTLIQKVKIGKHEKVFNSAIPLKLVEMDQMTRMEKQMRKLFKEVEELKKDNRELKEKLNMVDYEMISPNFDRGHQHCCFFDLSNDKKQITRNQHSNSIHYSVTSETVLSQEKNSKFQVKIHHFNSGTIAIGIATRDATKNHGKCAMKEAYSIASPNSIYENGLDIGSPNFSKLCAGFIVGVLFIPHRGEILVDINGIHLSTLKIDESHQKLDLYPFVSISQTGSIVSFI